MTTSRIREYLQIGSGDEVRDDGGGGFGGGGGKDGGADGLRRCPNAGPDRGPGPSAMNVLLGRVFESLLASWHVVKHVFYSDRCARHPCARLRCRRLPTGLGGFAPGAISRVGEFAIAAGELGG